MQYQIKFGTDGWRGVIAEDYTFDNVRRAAQGFASFLIQDGKQGQTVIVGYDKRFDSEFFGAAVAEVLAGNGFKVHLTDRATPTPVISFSVVNRHAAGAVNITASHNPPTDNGFKVRNEFGGAIDPEGLKKIEGLVPGRYTLQVEFPGFQTAVVRDVRVRAGDNKRSVTLLIQKREEAVTVDRDKQAAAVDPLGAAFGTVR